VRALELYWVITEKSEKIQTSTNATKEVTAQGGMEDPGGDTNNKIMCNTDFIKLLSN
jgi:hypothetical protein